MIKDKCNTNAEEMVLNLSKLPSSLETPGCEYLFLKCFVIDANEI